ncbi:hypothetical protein T484DRAFT_1777161 [Baffinella frigidus]|nr:hypothetical protein T484DRAFT_1777161 [Cryptophyta sp. CCMP2293]
MAEPGEKRPAEETGEKAPSGGAQSDDKAADGAPPAKKPKNNRQHTGATHTLLFQRPGGVVPRAFLVSCAQGKEAAAITGAVELIRNAMERCTPKVEDAIPDAAGATAKVEEGASTDVAATVEGAGTAGEGAAGVTDEKGADAEEEEEEGEEEEVEVAAGEGGAAAVKVVKAVEDTWVCDAGCNGVVCVTVEKKGIDPVEVLEKMWDQVASLDSGP